MIETLGVIVASAVGGGSLVALLRYRSRNRQDDASATKTLLEGMNLLVDPLRHDLERVRKDLADERKAREAVSAENEAIRRKFNALEERYALMASEHALMKGRILHLERENADLRTKKGCDREAN